MYDDQMKHYTDKLAYEIDAWDLNVTRKSGAAVIVVDARSPQAYAEQHIPGAVSIPHRTMTPESIAHLDRGSLVVTYCDGIGCNASTKGALNMSRLGFRVKELMGGLDWWKRDGYPTEGGVTESSAPVTCGCE